jgi:DNA-binding NtrC family response regulator
MATALRVAILNEDKLSTEIVGGVLRAAGHTVLEAKDAAGLLEMVANEAADVLVINLLVPNMTGIDLFHGIRSYDVTIPVVVDTGAPPNAWNGAASDPFAVILRKPHPAEDLVKAVASFAPLV